MASPPHGEDGHVAETGQKNGDHDTWQKENGTNERKTQQTVTISDATSVQRHQSWTQDVHYSEQKKSEQVKVIG